MILKMNIEKSIKMMSSVLVLVLIISMGLLNSNANTVNIITEVHAEEVQQRSRYIVIDNEDKILPRIIESTSESAVEENIVEPIYFTYKELDMLYYIVEREAQDLSMEHKSIITNVIINRVKSNCFPNTINEVIHQDGQFASLHNVYDHSRIPTQDTKIAVSEALLGLIEDNSQGALYFCNLSLVKNENTVSWFNSMEKLFDLEGHSFFR